MALNQAALNVGILEELKHLQGEVTAIHTAFALCAEAAKNAPRDRDMVTADGDRRDAPPYHRDHRRRHLWVDGALRQSEAAIAAAGAAGAAEIAGGVVLAHAVEGESAERPRTSWRRRGGGSKRRRNKKSSRRRRRSRKSRTRRSSR